MAPTTENNTVHYYKPQVHLHACYALVHRRGTRKSEVPSNATFAARGAAGDNNIDLWTDGSIYLQDSATGIPSSFKNVKEFLEFACHGEQGLHGYTKRLRAYYEALLVGSAIANTERAVLELQSLLSATECQIEQMEAACRESQQRLHEVREEYVSTTSMHDLQQQWLAAKCIDLGKICADLRTEVLEFGLEMDRRRIAHNDKLVEAQLEATRWKQQCETLQQTSGLERLTPMGMRHRA